MEVIKRIMQSTLMSSAWNPSNLKLATYFKSNDAAILIGNLLSKDKYFEEHTKKYKGWFFSTVKQIQKDTAIPERTQRRFIEHFKEIDLLEVKLKGVPPKRYFKINYYTLEVLLSVKSCESADLNLAKVQNQILRNACHINKIQDIKEEKKNNKKEKFCKISDLNEFKTLYPKGRLGTNSTLINAWDKMCKLPIKSSTFSRPKFKEIKKALNAQSKSERWVNQPKYIPLASTWINQRKWLDDADSLTLVENFSKNNKLTNSYTNGYKIKSKEIEA